MNREDAVKIFKDIHTECPTIRGDAIMIMPPNADDVESKGYQLHIKGNADANTVQCIEEIAKRYDLSVNIEPNQSLVVIYKPV